jgi:hypothetical protein
MRKKMTLSQSINLFSKWGSKWKSTKKFKLNFFYLPLENRSRLNLFIEWK